MAATGRHVRGANIVVDTKRAGTLEQFVAKDRPPAKVRRVLKTTWECLNCGNGLVSTRGISRCPRCGSQEIVKLVEPVASHQAPTKIKETLDDFDTEPPVDD